MENRDVKYDDCEAGVCARRYLVGLGADDRGGVQVSAVCSQNGCMNDYNPELSQLTKVVGLEVWIHRCDDHARKHRWAKFGGAKQWYCPVCKGTHETEREIDYPPKGPCILVSEVLQLNIEVKS